MKMKTHIIVMVIGFVGLLILGRFIGSSAILLFSLLCFFMMATMMFGMNHHDSPSDKK